jgi:putative membrane protein
MDVVLHWTVLLMLLGLAAVAAFPAPFLVAIDPLLGGWTATTPAEIALALMVLEIVLFLIGRFLFAVPAIRRRLIPAATASRRVRRRATLLFRLATEHRTRARTGVLLYLSLAEHRAEIVADRSIDELVSPDVWGGAMAALLEAVRDGRPADGMVAAVEHMGAVLAAHFPRSADDTNELPDRLILL